MGLLKVERPNSVTILIFKELFAVASLNFQGQTHQVEMVTVDTDSLVVQLWGFDGLQTILGTSVYYFYFTFILMVASKVITTVSRSDNSLAYSKGMHNLALEIAEFLQVSISLFVVGFFKSFNDEDQLNVLNVTTGIVCIILLIFNLAYGQRNRRSVDHTRFLIPLILLAFHSHQAICFILLNVLLVGSVILMQYRAIMKKLRVNLHSSLSQIGACLAILYISAMPPVQRQSFLMPTLFISLIMGHEGSMTLKETLRDIRLIMRRLAKEPAKYLSAPHTSAPTNLTTVNQARDARKQDINTS